MSVLKSIQNAVPPIHPEGHKFILVFLAGTVLLGWLFEPLFWIGLALTIWCALFFRDPVRVTPVSNSLVISPADGRISAVGLAVPLQVPVARGALTPPSHPCPAGKLARRSVLCGTFPGVAPAGR